MKFFKLNLNKYLLILLIIVSLFQIGFGTEINKSENNNFNLEYNKFLNFLKENYIINIQGIRNDSSIQYMSINLKDGNLIEDENSDAFILFEIKQEVLENIFKSNNIGVEFFNKVITGEIKLTKLDNRGVIEKVSSWFSSFLGYETNQINLTINCPNLYKPVCGINNKTYSNGCFANQENIQIKYQGICIKE